VENNSVHFIKRGYKIAEREKEDGACQVVKLPDMKKE
jgi:hypothetical protein